MLLIACYYPSSYYRLVIVLFSPFFLLPGDNAFNDAFSSLRFSSQGVNVCKDVLAACSFLPVGTSAECRNRYTGLRSVIFRPLRRIRPSL